MLRPAVQTGRGKQKRGWKEEWMPEAVRPFLVSRFLLSTLVS
jgi:hypothetical protein